MTAGQEIRAHTINPTAAIGRDCKMYSWTARVNVVFFLAFLALVASTWGSSLTTMWYRPVSPSRLDNVRIPQLKFTRRHYVQGDEAVVELRLDADLRDIWNWNVKQLFVYIRADFVSANEKSNHIVIWDRVVTEVEDALLQENIRAEYLMTDESAQLRDANVTLSVHWDIMPWIGALRRGGGPVHNSVSVRFPQSYIETPLHRMV